MMITAEQAKQIILDQYNHDSDENHVIYYCEISPNQDYWIIRCNTEKSIVYQQLEYLLIGVNAHLVNTETGEVEVVGSGQDVDEYLQDNYDLRQAGTQSYVLIPVFDINNKAVLIKLRQHLQCSFADMHLLFSTKPQVGFTGTRRQLQHIQQQLNLFNISSNINLTPPPVKALIMNDANWHYEDSKKLLLNYIQFIKQTAKR